MDRIRRLFLLLALVAPLHMLEQLAFGNGDIARIRVALDRFYALFANADQAAIVLTTTIGGSLLFLAYGLLAGGAARLISLGVIAVMSLAESHHIAETFAQAAYNAGVITSVPFVTLGVLLLVTIRIEYRRAQISWADAAPAYQAS
jgi:hypothetical protein